MVGRLFSALTPPRTCQTLEKFTSDHDKRLLVSSPSVELNPLIWGSPRSLTCSPPAIAKKPQVALSILFETGHLEPCPLAWRLILLVCVNFWPLISPPVSSLISFSQLVSLLFASPFPRPCISLAFPLPAPDSLQRPFPRMSRCPSLPRPELCLIITISESLCLPLWVLLSQPFSP